MREFRGIRQAVKGRIWLNSDPASHGFTDGWQGRIVLCWCFHGFVIALLALVKKSHKQSTLHLRFFDARTGRSLAGPSHQNGYLLREMVYEESPYMLVERRTIRAGAVVMDFIRNNPCRPASQ